MSVNWSKLKSGTDIRGNALKEENIELELTEEVAEIIGRSFISWLAKNKDKPVETLSVSVGMDSRISGEKLKKALIKGITDYGVNVYDCGMASTPAMFMSTTFTDYNYDGAVMITASHLPYFKNGFKFFTDEGGLEDKDIIKILQIAEERNFISSANSYDQGNIHFVDLISNYSQYIVNKVRDEVDQNVDKSQPLADLNIIVDAGNGAGGFFVEKILQPLGADTRGSQFLKPDGYFPNHIPNPENEEAMNAVKRAVVENNADLGIIFDTDVDRAAVVDKNGLAINRNKLIALVSAIVLEEHPGSVIVTDSVTSKGLSVFIEELGGYHHRFKRGYKNVINEAIRLNEEGKEAHLAIETSGHAAFKENYFLDDGAYLIAKILIKMANMKAKESGTIGELIATLKEAEIKKEYRMSIKLEEFHEYGQQVLQELKLFVDQISEWELAPNNFEGVRVNCRENDWFLLRMSLHDPVFVLNIECDSEENLKAIIANLSDFLEGFDQIDIGAITG